jgi:hypothetical protein
MSQIDDGSPGSHPRANQSNWRPGDDDADELLVQKLQDALRGGGSERQISKLLGVSRVKLWRCRMYASIPGGLVERLMAARVGSKALIYIARFGLDGEPPSPEIESCPHCGHTVRVRNKDILRALDIMQQWIRDGSPDASVS